MLSVTMSNLILPFCTRKIVKSICKYLGRWLLFGRYSLFLTSSLWGNTCFRSVVAIVFTSQALCGALIVHASGISWEWLTYTEYGHEEIESLLCTHTVLATLCVSSLIHTTVPWMYYHYVSQIKDSECCEVYHHSHRWWHWDSYQGLHSPWFML